MTEREARQTNPGESPDKLPFEEDREVVLKAGHLRKTYHVGDVEVPALRGVDLTVKKGEFVAIMGPSGSGKSTLLHLISGLDRPSGGDVMLAGQRLSDLDDEALSILRRRKVGFVFQTFNLIPMLTARENVMLPLLVDGRDPDQAQERMENLLQLVLIADRKDHKPDQLSGGQQQRVAIARALANDPPLIVADEPTGSLDSVTADNIFKIFQRLVDAGRTIVMVTHDMGLLPRFTRHLTIADGVITDRGEA